MVLAGLLIAVVPSLVAVPVEAPRPAARERIGSVLGEPIYRDQIKAGKDVRLDAELFRLIQPALDRYREEHRDEIRPTEGEVEFAAAYFRKEQPETQADGLIEQQKRETRKLLAELDAAGNELSAEEQREVEALRKTLEDLENSDRHFARWVVGTRKFQRHLYDEFGGGRVLFQQAGVEAFDATRAWLESLEAKGDLTLSDPELREELYRYWTSTNHGAFLSTPETNPDAIEEFVNPPWFPRKAGADAPSP